MDKNKINKLLGLTLLVVLGGFVVALVFQLASLLYTPTRSACTREVCLKKFLDGPPAYNDEYMANFLKTKFMTPPGSGALTLSNSNDFRDPSYKPTLEYINHYFKDRRDGRFVVLGAGDGEYEDLTLDLEQSLGWTGLLVEPNPVLHDLLKTKNRRAEISSNCVSPFSYPTQSLLAYPAFADTVAEVDKLMRYRETKMKQLWEGNFKLETIKSQCIPLANIIYAAETIGNKVDLLVLDMAGSDLDILLSTNLDWLPDLEMVVVVAHGVDVATEVGGYFMEKNMVVSKVFGDNAKQARFIITKFEANTSLVD